MKVTDTLGGINLNIRISFTMPDVLRVQTGHHMGQLLRTPYFDLKLDDPQKLQVDDSEESVTIKPKTPPVSLIRYALSTYRQLL